MLLDIPLPSDVSDTLAGQSTAGDVSVKVLLFSEALEPREAGLPGIHCESIGRDLRTQNAIADVSAEPDAYEVADAHAAQFESMEVRLVACRESVTYHTAAHVPFSPICYSKRWNMLVWAQRKVLVRSCEKPSSIVVSYLWSVYR